MIVEGFISDIKRYAIHDGPGIRTTVFFKGCPLRCWWCHNPESISNTKDLMFFEYKCIQCKTCINACPLGAIAFEDSTQNINRKICNSCGVCAESCPTGALTIVGKKMTVRELMKEIEKDVLFYDNSQGGVTFSGGEPLMQHQFLKQALKECKKRNIHTVLDTSGYAPQNVFREIAQYVDLFLYDLKLYDVEDHKNYTEVSNRIIKDNLKLLSDMGRGRNVIIRFPVIPGITDTEKNIEGLVGFVSTLEGIREIHLLPFHDVREKYNRLGTHYKMSIDKAPTLKKMQKIKQKFEKLRLRVKV